MALEPLTPRLSHMLCQPGTPSIHLLTNTWVVSIFGFIQIMLLGILLYRLSLSPCSYLGVELLGHMFAEPPSCFPQWLKRYTFIPTRHAQGLHFLHVLTKPYFVFVIIILMGVEWYLTLAFIFMYLMIGDVEASFHMLIGHLCTFSAEMCI